VFNSVSVNQNQGGSVYPFDGPCALAGLVSDISVIFDKEPAGDVYVAIDRTSTPQLLFSDSAQTLLLDTCNLELKYSENGFWYFSDDRGKNTVRYSEYLNPECPYPAEMSTPAKLVSRCWSSCTNNVYYDHIYTNDDLAQGRRVNHANQLQIILGDGLTADITGNTITFKAKSAYASSGQQYLKTINHINGDSNGNFTIEGDKGCILVSARPDIESQEPGSCTAIRSNRLVIRNDCRECCSCEDYAEQFHVVNRLVDIHNYEAAYLRYLRDYYTILQDYYNQTIDARMENLVQATCTPSNNLTTIGFSVSNPSSQSLYNVACHLDVISDNPSRLKRVFVKDAHCNCNHPAYDFTIPELRAHSTWTGAISVIVDGYSGTTSAEFFADIPWYTGKARAISTMSYEDGRCPDITIKEPVIKNTVCLNLPTPPLKSDYNL